MVIWSNKFNLPDEIVNTIKFDRKRKDGCYSVTELIKPPQIYQLEKRYDNKIEVDISDSLWALLGSAVHYVFEKAKDKIDGLSEETLSLIVGDIKITGRPDLYRADGTLVDFKVTSVWSFMFGDKPEWEQQLNMYAELYRHAGFIVKKLVVNAILRDWSKSRQADNDDYPEIPFKTIEVPLWDSEKAFGFIKERLLLHKGNDILPDDRLTHCSAKEQWEREKKFAVMNRNQKKAIRLFKSRLEAEKYLEEQFEIYTANEQPDKFKMYIEERTGEKVRCENYCNVRPFCNQYKEESLPF